MTRPLYAVPDVPEQPILNYPPPHRVNHAVSPAEWPFEATRKRAGDVVISSIRPTPDRNPKGRDGLLARFMRAGKGPKETP